MQRIDFKRSLKARYAATRNVEKVDGGRGTFLAVDGQGAPGGEAFQDAVQQVFSVAYTLKFMLKKAGLLDFAVAPLEALWHDDPGNVPDMSRWRWRVLVRIPDEVTHDRVDEAKRAVLARRGGGASPVTRVTWKEDDGLQVLHVGPYDRVGDVYGQLQAAALAQGMSLRGPGHEVYLSDPRRTDSEKLKTIVRMQLSDHGAT